MPGARGGAPGRNRRPRLRSGGLRLRGGPGKPRRPAITLSFAGRRGRRRRGFHQVLDEEAEELGAAADAGLAVDGVGMRLDRAFAGAAQPGDLGDAEALDGEPGDVALRAGQPPCAKRSSSSSAKAPESWRSRLSTARLRIGCGPAAARRARRRGSARPRRRSRAARGSPRPSAPGAGRSRRRGCPRRRTGCRGSGCRRRAPAPRSGAVGRASPSAPPRGRRCAAAPPAPA